jgi:hypothetical protein
MNRAGDDAVEVLHSFAGTLPACGGEERRQ